MPPTTPPSDPTQRFTGRAGGYDKHRPTYPDAAIDAILDSLGEPDSLTAADIGAGTGISSRLLADRGLHVIAIEPNASMLDQGRARHHPLIQWQQSTAEATGLPADSVNLVLCAQAFHWLDHPRALAEFARILRPRGRAAVIWNVQDETDPFTAAYRAVITKHALEPPTSPSFTGHEKHPRFDPPLWSHPTIQTFPHHQPLDADALIGRAASSSYCPSDGPAHESLAADLRALHGKWAHHGMVHLRYQTRLYMGLKRERA